MTAWIYAGDEEEDFWVVRCNFSKQQGLPTDGLSRMYNTKRASKINCMRWLYIQLHMYFNFIYSQWKYDEYYTVGTQFGDP